MSLEWGNARLMLPVFSNSVAVTTGYYSTDATSPIDCALSYKFEADSGVPATV